jgi:hypothetical protein
MWFTNKIKKALSWPLGKKSKTQSPASTLDESIDNSEPEFRYSYDLCEFSGQELYEWEGKNNPISFLFRFSQCIIDSYHNIYINGQDPSHGFLVIAVTSKSKNEVEQIALTPQEAWSEEADLAIKTLLMEGSSLTTFCTGGSVPGEMPKNIRELMPQTNQIRYLLVKGTSIILDYLLPIQSLGSECNFGGIDIYISPNLSQDNTAKVSASTGKIYYLMHSEMTGELPQEAAVRIQHGRNIHWSRIADDPYNKGIYVCVVDKNDLNKELPSAKIFTSASGNRTHAISLSTATKQYSQCRLRTSCFLDLVPEFRKNELLSEMHELAKANAVVEDQPDALSALRLIVFNKDSIADLECIVDAELSANTLEGLAGNASVPENVLNDIEEWTLACPQLASWISDISPENPLVILASTDSAIAAFRPSSALRGKELFNNLSDNSGLDKEDNDEDLAQKAGYFSLLRNNCSWIDAGGFSNAVEEQADIPMEPVVFNVETLIVVNDLFSDYQYFRGSTPHKIGGFTVEFNRDFLEYTSKFSKSESNSFEEFKECFGNSVGEIQKKLEEVLSYPRFDHGDGFEDIANSLLFCAQEEIAALCDYLEIPEIEFLKVFVEPDGFIVDRVFEPSDLIADYHRLKSGTIDEDDFIESLSETPIEFTVECHMLFKLRLEQKALIDMLYKLRLCDHLVVEDDSDGPSTKLEGLVNRLVESLGHLKPS